MRRRRSPRGKTSMKKGRGIVTPVLASSIKRARRGRRSQMPLPPPQSSGLAPPMSGSPSQIPGPGKTSREKMMQAARLLFDAIAEEPTLAGDLNDIIESLTTVIRQSAEALGPPPGAPDGIAGTPPLDRTPAGPSGGPMASPVAGGALPAVIQTLLRGRGM